MDFNTITLFGKKTFADLLKEIHTNSSNKEREIRALIDNLKPFITSAGDAVIIVPLIKDYLDVSVKNDDLLIKMAGIVQRAMNSNTGGDDLLLSDSDKEMLFQSMNELDAQVKVELPKIENEQFIS
jgi:hypothetical protein